MMGNVGDPIFRMFKGLMWLVLGLVIGLLLWMIGCTVLHVSYDKHYVGEPPKEERAADLIERIFDVETTEE